MAGETFRSAFTTAELIAAASTTLVVGQFNKLGEYQVPAGELVALGYGNESGQESAQGRLYMKLMTSTPTEVSGTIRMEVWSPQDRPIEIVHEFRTEALSNSTDRTKQIPFPIKSPLVSEDKKIVLMFKPDFAATLAKASCTINMDITKQVI